MWLRQSAINPYPIADEIMTKSEKIKVYFDGACYVCSHEIELYKKKDKAHRIAFEDISAPGFDPLSQGLDPKEIVRVFHVRTRSGELLTGVEAFMAIWNEIDSLHFLGRLARLRIVRLMLEAGYKCFVVIRPYLPRKKCATDACKI